MARQNQERGRVSLEISSLVQEALTPAGSIPRTHVIIRSRLLSVGKRRKGQRRAQTASFLFERTGIDNRKPKMRKAKVGHVYFGNERTPDARKLGTQRRYPP